MTSERTGQDHPEPMPVDARGRVRRRVQIVVALTLLLIGLAGVGLLRLQSDPPNSTRAARIAVVDATGTLVTMDPRGDSPVSYKVAGLALPFPAWSPDGARIAVVVRDEDGTAVHVFDGRADGDSENSATVVYDSPDKPPFYLYWTPDGRRLTFLTSEPLGLALRVVPADGSTPDSIIRSGAPMYWALADADRLLIHSGGSEPGAFLGELTFDGAPVEPSVIVPGRFQAPGVTHDGRYRAYVVRGTDSSGEIVVESRDGSSRRSVTTHGSAAIAFDPSGDTLAFIAPDEPGGQVALPIGSLRALGESGSARTLLGGSVVAFFWAPDGRTIAALRVVGPIDGDVAVAAAQAQGVVVQLVFVDVAAGAVRSERPVRLADIFVSQVLPFFDQYALSHRLWSPDSASVSLPLIGDDGIDRLYVIPADGSDPRAIADGAMGFWSP